MSSSNPGFEDEEDDLEKRFSFNLPPQTPSASFFIDSPTFLPEDLLGYTEDFSLLFPDDHYIQNIPENTSTVNLTHQESQPIEQAGGGLPMQFGQEQQKIRERGEVGPSTLKPPSSSMVMMEIKQKKMDHNAKERVRRRQLNDSYLALRSLLPNSQKPKEKWSAPYIIDRTVDYIPQLEGEIEKLKSNKEDVISELEKAQHLKQANENLEEKAVSVSINEIKKGQVIIQVCHPRNKADMISELLYMIESEGMEVLDASVFDPCEDRSCCHFRIQMDESSIGDDYVAELKEKVDSWLS